MTDAKGNKTGYAYGVTTSLSYDPLLRLYQIGTSGGMKLVYDGANIIGQSTGTTVGRRYVTVPGSDEVLVEYRVSNGTRDYKLTDERGSVIATTDASGNASNINTYDEYGIPGPGNSMRFQYTGQFFLTELGLQYSKGRIYSPTLGRFLQTDPIGYGDGMNWYNYVKGDPVNATDPSGLEKDPGDIIICGNCHDIESSKTPPPWLLVATAAQPRCLAAAASVKGRRRGRKARGCSSI